MADQERTFNDKFASVEDKMREIGSQGNENSRKLDVSLGWDWAVTGTQTRNQGEMGEN